MQRFGTYNIKTYVIGKEVLKKNWIKVCHLILVQHADTDESMAERKEKIIDLVFEKFNIDEALTLLDRRDRLEKSLLCVLRTQPNSYYNAFNNISRGTRFIYVHAYQSYVWNRAVSERLSQFGSENVLIGDLAVTKESEHLLNETILEEAEAIEIEEDDEEDEEPKQKQNKGPQ